MSQYLEVKNPSGKYIRIENPDSNTNDVTIDGCKLVESSGTVGGSGSAGAGNQYVIITVNGVNYKVLHDGTI